MFHFKAYGVFRDQGQAHSDFFACLCNANLACNSNALVLYFRASAR
jgi:hypothetical protein